MLPLILLTYFLWCISAASFPCHHFEWCFQYQQYSPCVHAQDDIIQLISHMWHYICLFKKKPSFEILGDLRGKLIYFKSMNVTSYGTCARWTMWLIALHTTHVQYHNTTTSNKLCTKSSWRHWWHCLPRWHQCPQGNQEVDTGKISK